MRFSRRRWEELGSAARRLWMRDRAVSRVLTHKAAGRWYRVVRAHRKSTKKELREAYRRSAKRVHPDKTRDERASEAFGALHDAYDLLSDVRKRKAYDEKLAAEDRRRQIQRQRGRAAAARTARRLSVALGQKAWEHKRVTAGVAGVLTLAIFGPRV